MKKKTPSWGNYLNICFYMMGFLNLMIVVFLSLTIVFTQYRIADAQDASAFLRTLEVMPEEPAIRLVIVFGSFLMLCSLIHSKRNLVFEKPYTLAFLHISEVFFVILLMKEMDMAYNGIIFFVVVEMLFYVEDRRSQIGFLCLAFLCYIVCSYHLITLLFPMNSFETWVSYYDYDMEKYFLAMKTVCEISNMVLFLVNVVLLLFEDRKENERIRILNEQLQKANEQLHRYADVKEQMGETKERNRLAREIHDTLGHILTGISVGIDAVLVLMETSPKMAKKQLENIGETARQGLKDVRRSVRKLKPDALERLSLENAIHQMIEDIVKVTNTKIYFVSYMDSMDFEADEEETLYRIIQESTTNAIRHGKATEIWIRMNQKNNELTLIISDNGCGCSNVTEGFGLRHMKERVELLNGEVHFTGMVGFTVIAKIPIRERSREITAKKETT